MMIISKIPPFYTVILISIFIYSCKKDDLSENITNNQNSESLEEYVYNVNDLSDYIYDQSKLHRFDILISQENLNLIDNDPTAEQYVDASFIFEDKIVKDVGVRYKGSIGAFVGCLSGPNWSNPSGYKTCPKLSMKIKINYKNDKKFYDLKKLQFHSQNLDPTKMRERLGYYMFRNFGIPAPRSNHAVIFINGEFSGLYANTEQIDGPFTNKNFINKNGNLYKEVWPVNDEGQSNSIDYFISGLRTNEEISDVSRIKKFSDELADKDYSNSWNVVQNYIDKDIFLKTLVVDRRIANDDGFLHFYLSENGQYENHNFYWYEDPITNNFQIIPWDLDNAFENLVIDSNPVTPIKDKWYEISNNCSGFSYGIFNLMQKSAACDKIIGSFKDYTESYYQIDSIFTETLYNTQKINMLIDTWSNQIRSSVINAHKKYENNEPSEQVWLSSLNNFKNLIDLSLKTN
tara:strand:+ start:517 stop:1896 length:1380 start_codon:yes stop_codon:yes gene_type:complete